MLLNTRQKLLNFFYPMLMELTRVTGKGNVLKNENMEVPVVSFYSLSILLNNKTVLKFDTFRGKKILVVNTASNCGYTAQYGELQKLYNNHQQHLTIIAFPANDFKEQEKGNDEEIQKFCSVNFNINFPIAARSSVIKGPEQNIVFKWLTDKSENGWNDQEPSWNFSKYLINEEGILTHYFDPAISPLSKEMIHAINLH